jgi:hypothetical protein
MLLIIMKKSAGLTAFRAFKLQRFDNHTRSVRLLRQQTAFFRRLLHVTPVSFFIRWRKRGPRCLCYTRSVRDPEVFSRFSLRQ